MLTTWLKNNKHPRRGDWEGRAENTELSSSHRYIKITTTYKATIYENDLKASRKDFPQLKISSRNHNKMDRKDEDAIQAGYTGMVMHKWESYHNCGGSLQGTRGPNPTLVFPGKGFRNGKTGPQNVWLWKNNGACFWESQTAVGNRDSAREKGTSVRNTVEEESIKFGIKIGGKTMSRGWVKVTELVLNFQT